MQSSISGHTLLHQSAISGRLLRSAPGMINEHPTDGAAGHCLARLSASRLRARMWLYPDCLQKLNIPCDITKLATSGGTPAVSPVPSSDTLLIAKCCCSAT